MQEGQQNPGLFSFTLRPQQEGRDGLTEASELLRHQRLGVIREDCDLISLPMKSARLSAHASLEEGSSLQLP